MLSSNYNKEPGFWCLAALSEIFILYLQEVSGVLKTLEESLADVQRVDAKAQSALDLKKQNLKDETKKRKELVKSMDEVMGH